MAQNLKLPRPFLLRMEDGREVHLQTGVNSNVADDVYNHPFMKQFHTVEEEGSGQAETKPAEDTKTEEGKGSLLGGKRK